MNEIWKNVIGYEGHYQVSNGGLVRGVDRVDGNGHWRKGKMMTMTDNGVGHFTVMLSINATYKRCLVQKLVMRAFVGDVPEGHNINHKNGNTKDNRLDNLEYVTFSENTQHALKVLEREMGLRGSRNPGAKLTDRQVVEIRQLYATGKYSARQLSEIYPASRSAIGEVVAMRTYI